MRYIFGRKIRLNRKSNGCDPKESQPFFIYASLRGAASDVAISYIIHPNEIPTLTLFARNDALHIPNSRTSGSRPPYQSE